MPPQVYRPGVERDPSVVLACPRRRWAVEFNKPDSLMCINVQVSVHLRGGPALWGLGWLSRGASRLEGAEGSEMSSDGQSGRPTSAGLFDNLEFVSMFHDFQVELQQ
jgi:hypothetical protein